MMIPNYGEMRLYGEPDTGPVLRRGPLRVTGAPSSAPLLVGLGVG